MKFLLCNINNNIIGSEMMAVLGYAVKELKRWDLRE